MSKFFIEHPIFANVIAIITVIIGIVGALLGGFVVTLITNEDPMDGVWDISSLLTAIVGAVVVVIVVGMIQGRSRTGSGPV